VKAAPLSEMIVSSTLILGIPLPWRCLLAWMECACAVTSDLELGQALEVGLHRRQQQQQRETQLIEQINSNEYPGLVWLNKEKSIFHIPWKHAGKQDYYCKEDAALFKDYIFMRTNIFKHKPYQE
ncbi:UNVERIFIED_CONTAM: hypothetical protein K2H54_070236, partial [Gekko kuhli]